jgi:hypothetical protein
LALVQEQAALAGTARDRTTVLAQVQAEDAMPDPARVGA